MSFRRTALLLSMVGILGVSLVGASQAAATTRPAVAVESVEATGFGILSNCPVTSNHGHTGAYICETQTLTVTWSQGGSIILYDNVVIGTDYKIYHDAGPGWSWLQGGVASSTVNPTQIGLFIISPGPASATIGVIGTDGRRYCNTTTSPAVWAGWRIC